jgi:hypothetical protein
MEEIQRIGIELYRGASDIRQGLHFDMGVIASRLQEEFPGIWFEEDYYERQLAKFKEALPDSGSKEGVLRTSRKDARELGPKLAFTVSEEGVVMMRGCIARYRLSFSILNHTPAPLRDRADKFLKSFCLKRFNKKEG